ncbi:MAG: hypothetical protein HN341_14865, partial [Verrucomicrobia bacterium]|nr:hypothetical protein [Verrucomicrobiota bacterium]
MQRHTHRLSILAAMLVASLSHAAVTVELKATAVSHFVYEPLTLRMEIHSAETPEVPSPPAIQTAVIVGISQPVTTGSGSNATHTITLELIPEEAGILTIPPITVQAGDQSADSAPLRLAVHAPRQADEMELTVVMGATNLYVDQPTELSVTWSSRALFVRCLDLQLSVPILRHAGWDVYPLPADVPEKQRMGMPLNNQRVIARKSVEHEGVEQLTCSYMVVPRRAGIYQAEAADLSCALMAQKRASNQYPSYFDNHFFHRPDMEDRFERVYCTADVPAITVRALPDSGRTVRYSGIVGTCSAQAAVQPTQTVVGQPMLLTISLTNVPFGGHIKSLPAAVLEDPGPEFLLTPRPIRESTTATSRSFTYIIRPLRSGIESLPALALQVFCPRRGSYEMVRTQPLSIRVEPDGKETVYKPVGADAQKPLAPLAGIRNNKDESRLSMSISRILTAVGSNAW